MNYAALKTVQWPLLATVVLVMAFIMSNFHFMGQARDIERFYATITQEPDVFKSDAFALSSLNDMVMWINSHITDDARMILYYLFLFCSLALLWYLGKRTAGSAWGGAIVILLHMYSTYNYLSLNQVLLSRDFAGQLMAGPFILLSFLFFLEKRFYVSSLFAACAFYFHPGVCLWYLIALFSHIPCAVVSWVREGRSKTAVFNYLKEMFYFICLFATLIGPRLYQILVVHGKPSLLDPQVRYDLLRYLWYSQTSLWMCLKFDSDLIKISFISNIILFILIVHYFLKEKMADKIQVVFWMYAGSFIFLIFNEVLIHMFDFRLAVVYGLSRISGFNFLFMAILLGAMMVAVYRQKRFIEFFLWAFFIFNYAVLHYKNVSPLLQIVLLAVIVLVRLSPWTKTWDRMILDAISRHRITFRRGIMVAGTGMIILTLGLTVMRVAKHIRKNESVFDQNYAQAIQYVNEHNRVRGMVMYPFNKPEEFFYYTKNPGFFTVYYVVLFIDTYNYDADEQWKAYQKFTDLEKEFAIDTMANLKKDPTRYSVPWKEAWESKVDGAFVERWSARAPIKYIIRENQLSDLPYQKVYQNESYKVYERL